MDSEKIQFIIELLKQGDTKDSVQSLKDVADQAAKTQDALKQLSAQSPATPTADPTKSDNGEIQNAQQTTDKILALNDQKKASNKEVADAEQKATDQLSSDLQTLGNTAETDLSKGLTTAFTSIINGSKSAEEAFKAFAATFLEQIAQMILQTIILDALKSVFGSGGVAVSDSAEKNADGGINFAAHGIMLAAAGVAGVSQVNSPTLFPKFNVLAGEAGSEMLTVLAKPQTADVNGQPAVLGNVGPHRLAILSQESLSRMVNQPRLMAEGGMAGALDGGGGNTGLKVSTVSPQTDGRIVVELTPHPAYEQRVVQNSIAGARVQIASDLNTDTPIRRNAQGILA